MAEFYERLKEIMKERNVSQTELCARTKIPKSAMSQYISGAFKPKQDRTYLIARALNVSEAWLMGFDVPMERRNDTPSDFSDLYEKYPNIKPITKKKIPMLGTIACGEPIYADEDNESYIEVNTDLNADFCLTCSGDSMINANIFDGDIVFIRKQDIVDDGQIAAVIIENEATLKRVYYDRQNGRLTLQAENPRYSPLVYIGEELNSIRILGRAVSLYRKIHR